MVTVFGLRRIILRQAMRAIRPGMANDTIGMIRGTSIAWVIFVNELTFRSQQIVGQNFKFFTVFAAAGVIYLIMTSAVAACQALLERHFNIEIDREAGRGSGFKFFNLPLPGFGPKPAAPPAPAALAPAPAATDNVEAAASLDWIRNITNPTSAELGIEPTPFVVFRNVHKAYGSREVLRGIDLTVNKGEVVVVMGPSGSGKSTLLRLVNHLESLDWGGIILAGKYIGYQHRHKVMRPPRAMAKARAQSPVGLGFG